MEEIWKDIDGYEGLYEVSNTGKVRSHKKGKIRLLVQTKARGYFYVGLCKEPNGKKSFLVHRLVASAFIPNPNNYHEINHKDEDKANNNAENLEWCSRGYNMSYKTARLRQGISCGIPVEQLTVDNIKIAIYSSSEVAGKLLNIDPSSIHKCCKGRRIYTGGYKWKYSDSVQFSSQ